VSELDEAWALALAEAQRRAHAAGRRDLAEYLTLRAVNDLARTTAIDWLINEFTRSAGDANRIGASIQMSTDDAHRFAVGTATMVGRRLILSCRVRALSIEVGWPRTPSHGFIRGGGLARGHIRHRGRKSRDLELTLVQRAKGSPHWMTKDGSGAAKPLTTSTIRAHIERLAGDDY